jgi:hypothetical protein
MTAAALRYLRPSPPAAGAGPPAPAPAAGAGEGCGAAVPADGTGAASFSATAVTALLCPLYVRTTSPVPTSHSLDSMSDEAVTR